MTNTLAYYTVNKEEKLECKSSLIFDGEVRANPRVVHLSKALIYKSEADSDKHTSLLHYY